MSVMTHNSGKPLCVIYCDNDFNDNTRQGPIINFNLLRASGDFVGYSEVRVSRIQQFLKITYTALVDINQLM